MKTIVLTGGGTAGHVTPNLALLPSLKEAGFHVIYIGSHTGIEKQLAQDAGLEYYGISSGKLRRYLDIKNFSDPFRVIKGCAESLKLLKKIKPDIVFSKGGFVSVPVVWAAKRRKIPVVLHESDYTPGLANKLMKNDASYICTTFPETAAALGSKGVYVGTPIRAELLTGSKEKGLQITELDHSRPILLMTGGSQGAAAINQCLREALPEVLKKYQVIHLCGKGNLAEISMEGYYQQEYASDELPDLLAAADMILSRAGSNSIYEFLALRKPMLLIPLPLSASRGDQILNAKSFVKQGFAHLLEQENMTPETLLTALDETWQDAEIRTAMVQSPAGEGVKNIMKVLEKALAKS